ncbi:hypothetical protein FQN60_006246, partial [Etheostoma spectabile]
AASDGCILRCSNAASPSSSASSAPRHPARTSLLCLHGGAIGGGGEKHNTTDMMGNKERRGVNFKGLLKRNWLLIATVISVLLGLVGEVRRHSLRPPEAEKQWLCLSQ